MSYEPHYAPLKFLGIPSPPTSSIVSSSFRTSFKINHLFFSIFISSISYPTKEATTTLYHPRWNFHFNSHSYPKEFPVIVPLSQILAPGSAPILISNLPLYRPHLFCFPAPHSFDWQASPPQCHLESQTCKMIFKDSFQSCF